MKRGLVRKFWIGATLLIIVLTAFAAGRNLIHAFKIRSQIRVLEREKALYEEKIARDSALIEQLKQDDFLEQYAREHGCTWLRIDTNARNVSARRLYARLGYREVDIVPGKFNGIPDVQLVCMEKRV